MDCVVYSNDPMVFIGNMDSYFKYAQPDCSLYSKVSNLGVKPLLPFHAGLFQCLKKLTYFTPARTLSISGLKSRVLKLSFLSLKMMAKSGLELILKFTEPLQRYLLSCQANSAILGRYFCTGQQQL